MSADQKEPWNRFGKQKGETYAKAKTLLDKKHAEIRKTAAVAFGPKQRAVIKAKTRAKAAVVTKTKVNNILIGLPPTYCIYLMFQRDQETASRECKNRKSPGDDIRFFQPSAPRHQFTLPGASVLKYRLPRGRIH